MQKLGGESQPLYTVDVLVNLTQGSYYPSPPTSTPQILHPLKRCWILVQLI